VQVERERKLAVQAGKQARAHELNLKRKGHNNRRAVERRAQRKVLFARVRAALAALHGASRSIPTARALMAVYDADVDALTTAEALRLSHKAHIVSECCRLAVEADVKFSRDAVASEVCSLPRTPHPGTAKKWWPEFLEGDFCFARIRTGKASSGDAALNDAEVQETARRWVRRNRVRKGKPDMTVKDFACAHGPGPAESAAR
jgi:hypothetical protein